MVNQGPPVLTQTHLFQLGRSSKASASQGCPLQGQEPNLDGVNQQFKGKGLVQVCGVFCAVNVQSLWPMTPTTGDFSLQTPQVQTSAASSALSMQTSEKHAPEAADQSDSDVIVEEDQSVPVSVRTQTRHLTTMATMRQRDCTIPLSMYFIINLTTYIYIQKQNNERTNKRKCRRT